MRDRQQGGGDEVLRRLGVGGDPYFPASPFQEYMPRSQASRGFLSNVSLRTRKAGVEGCASSNTQVQVALKRVGVK